jgi:PAS domain-containing protein
MPGFAKFILDHHLEEFSLELLRLYQEVDIPMLAFFKALPPEQLIQLSNDSSAKLLAAFVGNRASGHIDATLQRWAQDQLKVIGRNQIATKDISLIGFVRKQALLSFLVRYTADPVEMVGLIREMDLYALEQSSRATELYIRILEERIDQQLHFNQKITDAAPAIISIYNIHTGNYLFISQGFELLLGYSPQQVMEEGLGFLMNILHPDDLAKLMDENRLALEKADQSAGSQEDVQVPEFTYRMRHQN